LLLWGHVCFSSLRPPLSALARSQLGRGGRGLLKINGVGSILQFAEILFVTQVEALEATARLQAAAHAQATAAAAHQLHAATEKVQTGHNSQL